MARVWFLMIVLTVLLPACTAEEPRASVSVWKTMVETHETSRPSAATAAEKEKESTLDCLRKSSLIDAWDCASKD
jgi:hypothetical protein